VRTSAFSLIKEKNGCLSEGRNQLIFSEMGDKMIVKSFQRFQNVFENLGGGGAICRSGLYTLVVRTF